MTNEEYDEAVDAVRDQFTHHVNNNWDKGSCTFVCAVDYNKSWVRDGSYVMFVRVFQNVEENLIQLLQAFSAESRYIGDKYTVTFIPDEITRKGLPGYCVERFPDGNLHFVVGALVCKNTTYNTDHLPRVNLN